MFSSRVCSKGLSKYLSSTATHITPASGVVPFYKERLYNVDVKQKQPFLDANVVRQPFSGRGMTATVSLLGRTQVRYVHTDMACPDFSDYRSDVNRDPNVSSKDHSLGRKAFSYAVLGASAMLVPYTAKSVVNTFVLSWAPAADILAMSKVEVELSTIPVGKAIVVKWRGKPLFVRHRTAAEIDNAQSANLDSLRHPQMDADRVQKPEWLVLIGICTHLGCVPISHAGDYQGYYCPCHGSHYDVSGRIRKGPAPLNLEVPQYEFNDSTLIVG